MNELCRLSAAGGRIRLTQPGEICKIIESLPAGIVLGSEKQCLT